MKKATIIFAPEVDAAILRLIDYVDPSEIPAVLDFLDAIQGRMVRTLTDAPEGGPRFKGQTRMFPLDGYTFLYEYHVDRNEVHVLDLMMPGQNWR